jgi:hypothetical protein
MIGGSSELVTTLHIGFDMYVLNRRRYKYGVGNCSMFSYMNEFYTWTKLGSTYPDFSRQVGIIRSICLCHIVAPERR